MAEKQFIVNSRQSMLDFTNRIVPEIYGDRAYIIFSWKKGKEASMPQKALVHIWFRTYAAYLLKKREKDVTKYDLIAMKLSCKKRFYNETHAAFMIEIISDPFEPDSKRKEMTSIGDWSQADCYHFMTWLQQDALHRDLILESIGEHQTLTHESNGQ